MSNLRSHTTAVILAAGIGARMGAEVPKQYIELGGISILKRSVLAFSESECVDDIIVVTRMSDIKSVENELSDIGKISAVISGGESRAESAACGLSCIKRDTGFVAIHDAARPLITAEDIDRVIHEAQKSGAAIAVSPVVDTIKSLDSGGNIVGTVSRDALVRAQTPQVFDISLYRRARNNYFADLSLTTDDSMFVEFLGVPVVPVVIGDYNIKITTPLDLVYANSILEEREKQCAISE